MVVQAIFVTATGESTETDSVRRELDHQHAFFHRHDYHDGRQQYDETCKQPGCGGVARVQIAYAPDRGRNWTECCCCGHRTV